MIMAIKYYRTIPTTTIITTMKMTVLLPKLVKQGFDRYKITLIDNINLLQTSYREYQDIIILRVRDRK